MNDSSNDGNSAATGTQSIRRALSVLLAFDDENPEWKAADLARHVDLNRSTAYRILTTLKDANLLVQDPDTSAYRLGPEAISLGGRAARTSDLQRVARTELEALARDVGETATLEILTGWECLILDEVAAPRVLVSTMEIGTRWPAHATSTGKVLLAWQFKSDSSGQADLSGLPEELPRYTDNTHTSRESLRRELETVRELGYATASGELEQNYAACAAPISDADGRVVAAVSVSGPGSRLSEERLSDVARRVREAGRRISERLGSPDMDSDSPAA